MVKSSISIEYIVMATDFSEKPYLFLKYIKLSTYLHSHTSIIVRVENKRKNSLSKWFPIDT